MSWIKENKFVVALGGGTLVIAIVLLFVGSKGASKYEQAEAGFNEAFGEANSFVKGPLYPSNENLNGKKKAIDEYRKSVDSIQGAFEPFRPKEIKNSTPQDFTNHLIAVDAEVRKAFENSETKLPENFFCGFEGYKTSLARGNATGILDYQLSGVKNVMLALAASGATELKNLHRPALPEESGAEFKPAPTDVARPLPLEVTFMAPEKSVRAFLSSITKAEGQYVIVRSLRITNAKKEAPKASDAKFEKPAAAPATADVVGGAFVLPGEEPAAPGGEAGAPAGEAAPAPAPAPSNSNRILAQVLGNEELLVFVRLDLMQFLPAKKLP